MRYSVQLALPRPQDAIAIRPGAGPSKQLDAPLLARATASVCGCPDQT
ncbi:MAG: hypothetical protein JO095_06080 [Alphaproteobacteria bacterium]|nr:hypothetical protein [Alphaproteobacteria bacterium]